MAKLADKERRQKRIAIGGAVLLVAVLGFQGPKILKTVRGSGPAPAAAASASPAPAPSATAGSTPAAQLKRHGGAPDPFAPRAIQASTPAVAGGATDPGFKLVADESIVGPERALPGTVLTVVLRSIPVSGGRAAAASAAEKFRAKGLRRVRVIRSGDYRSLRRGYYVVTAGRFATRGAALPTLAFARVTGADNPYIRLLRPR